MNAEADEAVSEQLASFRLDESLFGRLEVEIARSGGISVSAFRYPSGVAALRIANGAGEVLVLPFQGQQVWDATFFGRRLTMRSMFDSPVPTRDYKRNYGALLLHCGGTAMGNPGPDDTHPLHGELPNLPLEECWLHVCRDFDGTYVEISGEGRDTLAFAHDFVVRPRLRIREQSSVIGVDLVVENEARTPLLFMYLAHINFRPVDGATLHDTARDDTIVLRRPALDEAVTEAMREYHNAVSETPSFHRAIRPGLDVLPELVLTMKLAPSDDGWAHALQRLPDGSADFVSFRPDQLPYVVRWLIRGPNEDALGLALPSSAAPDGLATARRNGQLVSVAPGAQFQAGYRFGAVNAAEANALVARIGRQAGGYVTRGTKSPSE